MDYLILLIGTLILGYYAFIVWMRPAQLRQYLREFYNNSWVKDVASSSSVFWFIRLLVSLMFAAFLVALLTSIVYAFLVN